MSSRNTFDYTAKQSGFSLVELLIALMLGLVLMGGVIQVFITTKQAYNLNEEMTWIQENARFSMGFISEDLRMAGYYGCASRANSVANVLNDPDSSWVTDFGKGLQGYDGDGNSSMFPDPFPQPVTASLPSGVPKTDVFTIHRGDIDNALSVTNHVASSAVISTAVNHNYPDNSILVISDCSHSAVFQLTGKQDKKVNHNKGNSASPGNCTKGLGLPVTCSALGTGYTYKEDAFVMRAIGHAYYVELASNNVPSLYRESLGAGTNTVKEELVQGVENMQVQYGLDSDGDSIPDRYLDADDISDAQWQSDVITARVTFLLRSLTELASEPQPFTYLGTSYTPTDNYVRRVYSTTVKLRNRGV